MAERGGDGKGDRGPGKYGEGENYFLLLGKSSQA